MAELEIKVTELEEGGKSYELPVDPAWLDRVLDTPDLRAAPDAAGRATFFAALSGTDVVVRGRLRTAVIAPCSRCLADTRIEVDADLTALFHREAGGHREGKGPDSKATPAELDLTAEDLDRDVYSGDTVVLDDLVREQVVLEVPMQVRCSDACPGLDVPEHVRGPATLSDAPQLDGKPIDPRLAPLLGLAQGLTPKGVDVPAPGAPQKKKRAS